MSPLNPLFAITIYAISFLTAYLINLKFKITDDFARYENIDGLRGFLALGVFIHHASIWYPYLKTTLWESPKSNLFNQLGQTSVAFFFMITAFLFVTKLLNTNDKEFDWKSFFISRLFRLVPMYVVSVIALITIVLVIDNGEIKLGILSFLKDIYHWFTFTIISQPRINDNYFTNKINAGVVWSLPFEWFFYFSLPLLSLFILKKRPSLFYIIVSILFILGFFKLKGLNLPHLLSFFGGAITPFIMKYGSKKVNYNSMAFSFIIVICLALLLLFDTSDNLLCKLLLIIIFNLIALGNSLFGILKSTSLKLLGEISYSTYLLHGMLIFSTMYFGFGFESAAKLSETQFCLTLFSITPVLVFLSFLGFVYIEKPFIRLSKRFAIKK
jgi:peptidoglycan/LPS O-acetylase OafA/YrhL